MARHTYSTGEVTLLVTSSNSSVNCFLLDGAGARRPFAPVGKGRLAPKLDELRTSLAKYSSNYATKWSAFSADERRNCIGTIFEAGYAVADALFGSDLEAFRAVVEQTSEKRLHIANLDSTFDVPWDFLALDKGGPFLGAILTVTPLYEASPADIKTDDEFADIMLSQPLVGLVEDHLLNSACRDRTTTQRQADEELYCLAPLVDNLDDIDLMEDLDPRITRGGEVTKFKEWFGKARSLVHFNCHAEKAKDGTGEYPVLRVNKQFMLGSDDMHVRELHNADLSYALVTLNACNSGVGRYSTEHSLSQFFHDQLAGAVVSTTGAVSDAFATTFAREFYSRLPGRDLLSAIDETRKELLRSTGEPMSLMWTFSGPSNFTLLSNS